MVDIGRYPLILKETSMKSSQSWTLASPLLHADKLHRSRETRVKWSLGTRTNPKRSNTLEGKLASNSLRASSSTSTPERRTLGQELSLTRQLLVHTVVCSNGRREAFTDLFAGSEYVESSINISSLQDPQVALQYIFIWIELPMIRFMMNLVTLAGSQREVIWAELPIDRVGRGRLRSNTR